MKVNISTAANLLGFSRQAYYKTPATPALANELIADQLKTYVARERVACPGKGCRSIYQDHASELNIGRDKAELFMRGLGLNIRKSTKYVRTTESGLRLFNNLLVEQSLTKINQVWQCDMTYYIHSHKTFYIMFITDAYSQNVVGYGAYERAFSSHFQEVLQQAIKRRKNLVTSSMDSYITVMVGNSMKPKIIEPYAKKMVFAKAWGVTLGKTPMRRKPMI